MNDTYEWVRRSAAGALGEIKDPRAIDPLIKALDNTNSDERESVANSLVRIGAQSAGPLIKALGDNNSDVRYIAAEILDKLNWKPSNQPELVSYLAAKKDWDKLVKIGAPSNSVHAFKCRKAGMPGGRIAARRNAAGAAILVGLGLMLLFAPRLLRI